MNLRELRKYNYVPYSGNGAMCVAESDRGHFFPGVRIENPVFPLTISEIQAAVFSCLSENEQPARLYTEHPQEKNLCFWKNEYNLSLHPLQELPDDVMFESVILPDDTHTEAELLESLLDRAITLNSDFPVSALLKTERGMVTGVNIECSEWSLGLCAERVALAKAVSNGARPFNALYIHTRYGEFSSPCGACRQVIVEHMPSQPVHLFHANRTRSVHYSSDLLPYSFRSSTSKEH